MKIEIDKIKHLGYYISVYFCGEWLNNGDIDKALKGANLTYEKLALEFGAYVDDSDVIDELFFEDLNDAKRLRSFLTKLHRT